MFGVGGVGGAARDRLGRRGRRRRPRRSASIASPSRTGGPAAGMTGFGKRIPQISTLRSPCRGLGSRLGRRSSDGRHPGVERMVVDARPAAATGARPPRPRRRGDPSSSTRSAGGRGRPARPPRSRRGPTRADRPKSQWPASVAGVDRGRRRVVEHDEVRRGAGLEPAEQRLAEGLAGDAAAALAASRSSGQSRRRRRRRPPRGARK